MKAPHLIELFPKDFFICQHFQIIITGLVDHIILKEKIKNNVDLHNRLILNIVKWGT